MSEREKAINAKPLGAYQTMQNDIKAKYIPGFEKHEELDKDNFRRFNRKGISPNILGENTDT